MKVLKLYGPPGCGKTKSMLDRLEQELQKTAPERIAFLTFTRAAKLEALGRTGKTQEELPWLRTIHSACYKQLQIQPGQIVKSKDLRYFGKQIGVKLAGAVLDPWASQELGQLEWEPVQSKADVLLHLNHLGRHRLTGLKQALNDVTLDLEFSYSKWFTEAYREWKTKESIYDYTDILTEYLQRGEPLDVDVLFVDEGQDCSKLQWQVVHKLGLNAERWYLAGDDDQAIFSWAGASPAQFMRERADEEQFLTQSYRLPRRVLKKSQEIIQRIQIRVKKKVEPRDFEGDCREVGYLDSRLFGKKSSFILFRNHHRGEAIARQLEELGVPFHGSHSVLNIKEVRGALEGVRKFLRQEPLTNFQARAIKGFCDPKNVLPGSLDGQEQVQVQQVLRRVPVEHEWPSMLLKMPKVGYLSRVVQEHGWDGLLNPKTELLSIHQSKGREAERVVLDVVLARKTFDACWKRPDDEHRVFYVAVTRAKEEVFTLLPEEALTYDL